MNTSIEKKKLLRYLSLADTIASSKSTIPVLSNVLLIADNGTFSVIASNLETGIKVTDTADVSLNGALAVNGKKLLSIVRELPESGVLLITDEHNRLEIKSESDSINAQFTVAGVPRSEFPEISTEPQEEYTGVKAGLFRNMIRKVLFSISSDENKYSLTGVFMENLNDHVNMVGTDGKRLALITKSLDALRVSGEQLNIPQDGAIVPKIVFSELLKYSFENDTLHVGFSTNQVFFMYDNIRLASNLIEGKYPEYKKIIPVERERFFTVERGPLISALRRVSVLVDESYNQVKLGVMKEKLVFTVQNPTLGEAVEEIPIEYEGEPIDITLNYVYLLDCLKEIESDRVKIDFEDSERVLSVYGVDEVGYSNLIMPMKMEG
jgi:DNA polymerase-3 subunit beta